MDEQLRSVTEELQTRHEELRAIDEELATVNRALASKVDELARAHGDLQALTAGSDLAPIEELRRSEARATAIVQSIADGLITLDRDWRVTYLNPAGEQMLQLLGKTNAQIRGGNFWEEFPDLLGTEMEDNYRRAVAEQKPAHFERFNAGIGKWFDVRAYPSSEGLAVYFLEITERKLAEEQRAEMADQLGHRSRVFDTTLSALTDFVYVIGRDGRFLFANKPLLDVWGLTSEEAIGRTFFELGYTHELATRLHRQIDEVCGTGRGLSDETSYTSSKGVEGYYEYVFSPVIGEDGTVEGIAGSTRNITSRKCAEAALRQSEGQFRALADAIPQLAWTAGPDGFVHWYNRRWYEYTGATVESMEGWGWQSVHDPQTLPYVMERWQASIATGETFEMVFPLRAADGEFRSFLTRVLPMKDAAGRVTQWFGTNTDVEELKRVEQELQAAKEAAEAANRSKDRFLAVLSHELRTPLTPVLMAVSALAHDPDLNADVREDLVMIKRNVELETKLIDDLLDLSRITSGKVELKVESVDLNEAVRHVCGSCRSQLVEQDIQLHTSFDDDICAILTDPARLQQVLWNVLKNAVKFTPAGGTVSVSTARLSEDRCEVRVQDTGIGISPDALPRIFDAFEQGDARITRQFGGLGLGLAISRALVELHGGTIRAESDGEGRGATFIIELPGDETPPADSVPAAMATSREAAPQMRLLLVEDHADTARTLTRLLRREGFEVVAANDVASAVATAGQETFDVLVSDLGLPDGDGYQVMRAVRAIRLVPGIAMSGYGMEEDIQRSRDAGFTEHLVKPINIPQLIASIRRVTDRG